MTTERDRARTEAIVCLLDLSEHAAWAAAHLDTMDLGELRRLAAAAEAAMMAYGNARDEGTKA